MISGNSQKFCFRHTTGTTGLLYRCILLVRSESPQCLWLDLWLKVTAGQIGLSREASRRQMSSSNSLAPIDPLLAFSLVVSERESENIAPQDVVPGRAKGHKREDSGSAGGNGTFWHRAIWIYRQKNFKPAPRKGKWRQIRQLFLKWPFGIIVCWRILQMLLFISLFICWINNMLKWIKEFIVKSKFPSTPDSQKMKVPFPSSKWPVFKEIFYIYVLTYILY